jgi:uncharacterized protein YbaP (TraB family)
VIRRLALAVALTLAACKPAPGPQKVTPALWEVSGKNGERAWLFGTIHALPAPVEWRNAKVDAALDAADRVVLEIAAIDNTEAINTIYRSLAASAGLPPLIERLPKAERGKAAELLRRYGIRPEEYGQTETWAAALAVTYQLTLENQSKFGIDRQVLEASKGKPVGELEGAERQLRIFDRLAEDDQRELLRAVLAEADTPDAEAQRLGTAWGSGDMAVLEAETRTGMLADPELRKALLVDRNADWTKRLEAMLRAGQKPFVAVGAAHMAGPDGLPALLVAKGYSVTRVQ